MSDNKLLYKKMTIEELVVLSQKDDFKALEELIKKNPIRYICYIKLSSPK